MSITVLPAGSPLQQEINRITSTLGAGSSGGAAQTFQSAPAGTFSDPVEADLAALASALQSGNTQGALAAFERLLGDMEAMQAHAAGPKSSVSLLG